MRLIKSIALFTLLFVAMDIQQAFARPEYAAREKYNCIQCHVSPWGGGPRKSFGKSYGSRDYEPGKHTEKDWYYADFRALYFKDTGVDNENSVAGNGLGLMTFSGSLNIPLIENDESYSQFLAVTHDFGSFAPGTREAYTYWQSAEDTGWMPNSVVFGRFYSPFGLLTDEHRTYTKFQTFTTLREMELGAVASWNLTETFHTDLGVTNGFPTRAEQKFLNSGDVQFSYTGNARWNPEELPFLLGASYRKNSSRVDGDAWASSFYGVLSFDRLVHDDFKLSLLTELTMAKGWNDENRNPYIVNFIGSDTLGTAYKLQIKDKTSRGIYAELKYEITPNWIVSYKLDHLIFDSDFTGDGFLRHGIGTRYQFNSNTLLLLRLEKRNITVPNFEGQDQTKADEENIFGILRFWL